MNERLLICLTMMLEMPQKVPATALIKLHQLFFRDACHVKYVNESIEYRWKNLHKCHEIKDNNWLVGLVIMSWNVMENLDSTVINVAETLMKNYLSHFFVGHSIHTKTCKAILSVALSLHTQWHTINLHSLFFNGPEKCVAWWLSG